MRDSRRPASVDTAFRLLAGEQRRQILRRLADTDETTLDDLEAHLRRTEGERWDGSPARRRIELHHVHLPKLADAGVIEYDPDAGVATRGPAFEAVVALLDPVDEHW